jgi:hypothetical protein
MKESYHKEITDLWSTRREKMLQSHLRGLVEGCCKGERTGQRTGNYNIISDTMRNEMLLEHEIYDEK